MRDIKVLHIEPTDVCQAACALCARETDHEFDRSGQHHLSMQKILQVFDSDSIARLDKMFMCGNYGDPAAGRWTLTIYKKFRELNPKIVLGMNTNGALRTEAWWQDLATTMNQTQDYVVFSIDGLSDTNAIYRRNVDWQRLMSNAKAFISAGGSAHWDMLVYRHNEHQVDACQQLAKDLGFSWFRAKVSKRGFTNQLQQPIQWHSPMDIGSIINCHALNEQSIYIDAQGNVSPCCWLGARQRDFVKDFDTIKQSWSSAKPNSICLHTCGSNGTATSFSQQWRREVALC